MLTHKKPGGLIPGSRISMLELEAPINPGYAFLGAGGFIGVQCACGWYVTARSLGSVQASFTDHLHPRTCISVAEDEAYEDEDTITE